MRLGRAKAARKTLQFFQRTLGIQPPYHILLDGTFLVALVKHKLHQGDPIISSSNGRGIRGDRNYVTSEIDCFQSRLDKLINHAPFVLITTRFVLNELKKLQEKVGENDPEKDEILQQARVWALKHCSRILEEQECPKMDKRIKNNADFEKMSEVSQHLFQLLLAGNSDHADKKAQQPQPKKTTKKSKADGGSQKKANQSTSSSSQPMWHPHYFVASQDEQLLDMVRRGGVPDGAAGAVTGTALYVPILRLVQTVLLLERPSKGVQQQQAKIERMKWSGAAAGGTNGSANPIIAEERKMVEAAKDELKEKERQKQEEARLALSVYEQRKRKKAKGPNPLSCKKKKKDKESSSSRTKRQKTNEGSAAQAETN